MITEVFFDIETQRLFSDVVGYDPAGLGVSIVSVYRRELDSDLRELSGAMQSFWERDLPDMWRLFDGVSRVIGFNSKRFDVPVLRPLAPERFSRLPHFDILEKVRDTLGHNLSLSVLAQSTLGREKVDVGTNAVKYWVSQTPEDLAKLKFYCEADVLLTRDLYDHLLQKKSFTYKDKWNTRRQQNIDISYPPEVITAASQMELF